MQTNIGTPEIYTKIDKDDELNRFEKLIAISKSVTVMQYLNEIGFVEIILSVDFIESGNKQLKIV